MPADIESIPDKKILILIIWVSTMIKITNSKKDRNFQLITTASKIVSKTEQ